MWKFWGPVQKEKILEIVSGGKGINRYEQFGYKTSWRILRLGTIF